MVGKLIDNGNDVDAITIKNKTPFDSSFLKMVFWDCTSLTVEWLKIFFQSVLL